MNSKNSDDQYTDAEAERRLQAALRGSRITGHKRMIDVQKKRMPKKAKKKPGKCSRASFSPYAASRAAAAALLP